MSKHAMLAARVFGVPLLISSTKLDAILAVLGPRLGLDLPAPAPGPETEPKEREGAVVEGRIARVQIIGTLGHRVDAIDAMSGMSSYETMGEEIDRLAADPDVDGILLEVDSFGGEAAGCFDLADRIRKARELKPIVGVASQYAMSAGYALLSQAGQVFVPQSGEIGSIGVVTTHIDRSVQAAQQGIKVTHIYAGKHKVDGSPFTALDPAVAERLAADVGTLYEQFINVVAEGRGARLSADAARETEALTYIGQAAVDAGLADHVGDTAMALDALRGEITERKRMKDLEAKVATLTGDLAAARAKLAEFESRERARLDADDAAYLEHLRAESAKMQQPISPEKLAKVAAHQAAGRREVARELGDSFLEAAEAKGGKPAGTAARKPAPLAPPTDNDAQLSAVRGEAAGLRRAGYTVVLSDDGRSIVSATPPGAPTKQEK